MKQRKSDRRRIERRAPRAGVNVRHEDAGREHETKRVKRARFEQESFSMSEREKREDEREFGE